MFVPLTTTEYSSYANSFTGGFKTILSSYFIILSRFYLGIIFISLQMYMSATQIMAVVMQMLLVQIPLVPIYANVTKDMMEMELIASVRNCVVLIITYFYFDLIHSYFSIYYLYYYR